MQELERYLIQTNKQSKYNNGGNALDNYIKYKKENREMAENIRATAEKVASSIVEEIRKAFDKKV